MKSLTILPSIFHFPDSGFYLFWDQKLHLKIKFHILDFFDYSCFHGPSNHLVFVRSRVASLMWNLILTYHPGEVEGRLRERWKACLVNAVLGWQKWGFPGAAAGVPLNQWPGSRVGRQSRTEKLSGLPKWGDLNAHSESQKVQATRINEENFTG